MAIFSLCIWFHYQHDSVYSLCIHHIFVLAQIHGHVFTFISLHISMTSYIHLVFHHILARLHVFTLYFTMYSFSLSSSFSFVFRNPEAYVQMQAIRNAAARGDTSNQSANKVMEDALMYAHKAIIGSKTILHSTYLSIYLIP